MGNPFERRLFIGDVDHTPNQDPEQPSISSEELDKLKTEREIFPNIAERFETTLAANNYERVTQLANGPPYPSVDVWLEGQIKENGRTSMYPSFVRDKQNDEILFCKARLKPRKDWGGLKNEAEVLQSLPPDSPTPQFIKYIPEQEETGQLELLITEAIKFSEGSVLPLKQWTAEQARDAATQLKKLEDTPIKHLPTLPQELAVTIQSVIDRSGDTIEPKLREEMEQILDEHKPYSEPVLIHGDLWLKNIIVGVNPEETKTIFVDWERGGAGYRGQDAGRMWWSLWENEATRQTVAQTYLTETSSEVASARQTQLKFGVVFEALRWLADRNDILKDPTKTEKHAQIRSQNKSIHEKVDAMLKTIEEISTEE